MAPQAAVVSFRLGGDDGVSVEARKWAWALGELEVKKAADKVVAHVRGGNGPYVMELKTYRYRGHSMSDPAKYRTKEEVSSYRKERDPIDALRSYMEENGMGDEASFKTIDREIKDIINQAAEFAQSSPEPDPSELWTDVLIEA